MPAGDKRGPIGEGPMTGRGMGACNDGTTTRRTFFGRRNGFKRGGFRQGGFGRGYNYVDAPQDANEIDSMKARIAQLEELLNK
jgi:hypothetical protein